LGNDEPKPQYKPLKILNPNRRQKETVFAAFYVINMVINGAPLLLRKIRRLSA